MTISRRFFMFGAAAVAAVTPFVLPEIEVASTRSNYHPAMAKAWAKFDFPNGLIDSYNIKSVERNGVGDYTVTFDCDFENPHILLSCDDGLTYVETNTKTQARVRSMSIDGSEPAVFHLLAM